MLKFKTPLIISSIAYGLAFLDGALILGFDDGMYILLGLAQLVSLVWMWVVFNKEVNK
jgi:hypothetical protein